MFLRIAPYFSKNVPNVNTCGVMCWVLHPTIFSLRHSRMILAGKRAKRSFEPAPIQCAIAHSTVILRPPLHSFVRCAQGLTAGFPLKSCGNDVVRDFAGEIWHDGWTTPSFTVAHFGFYLCITSASPQNSPATYSICTVWPFGNNYSQDCARNTPDGSPRRGCIVRR